MTVPAADAGAFTGPPWKLTMPASGAPLYASACAVEPPKQKPIAATFFWIDEARLQKLLEPGVRPLGHERLSVELARELSRLLRVFRDDPLPVHVHGEGDVAHRGELLGAPFHVRVEPPPLGNHEDARELPLRGLCVVVREKAFQLRARVLVHDGLRDDLRGGGVRGEEGGGGDGESLKRFHAEER